MPGNLQISEATMELVISKVMEKLGRPKYLTLASAAKYTGLAKRTIEDAARGGKFTNFVRARRRLIVRESLEAWIEGRDIGISTTP